MSKKQKKDLRRKVAETLTTTFSGLEGKLSPKQLKRNIKKASKVLVAGVKAVPVKKAATKKFKKKKEAVASAK